MLKLWNFWRCFCNSSHPKMYRKFPSQMVGGGMAFDSHDCWVVTSMHHDAASCFLFQIFSQLGNPFATPPSIVGGEHIKGRGTKIDLVCHYLSSWTCQPITQRSQEHDAFTGFLRVKSFNLNQQKVHQVRYLQYGCIFKASFQRVKAFKPEPLQTTSTSLLWG